MRKKPQATDTEGQRQLKMQGVSVRRLAEITGCGKSTCSDWIQGYTRPRATKIAALVAAGLLTDSGVFSRKPCAPIPRRETNCPQPNASVGNSYQVAVPHPVDPRVKPPELPEWPPAAGAPEPPPLPPRPPEPPPLPQYEITEMDLDSPGAARALVQAQILRLQADTARLRSLTGPDRPTEDAIRRAEDAERKAYLDLAKLAGELNPTEEAKLVRSAKWSAIKGAILAALEPYPQAMRAASEALVREGAES